MVIVDPGNLATVQAMFFVSKKRILTFMIRGLLGLWGFLGGVVLAEQLCPVVSSSEQEAQISERALAGLEQALQSKFNSPCLVDSPNSLQGYSVAVTISTTLSLRVRVLEPYPRSSPLLVPSSLDLYQFLSTYRI